MAAAVVRVAIATSTGPTLSNAESGIVFNRDNTATGTSATIPKPTSTGTAFSWPKVLTLEVTTVGTTSINNRRIHKAADETSGLELYYDEVGATYTQPAGVAAADAGTDNASPGGGYASIPTSATLYDNTTVATSSLGKNGAYLNVALGVASTYAGGAGSAISLPNIIITYDEF